MGQDEVHAQAVVQPDLGLGRPLRAQGNQRCGTRHEVQRVVTPNPIRHATVIQTTARGHPPSEINPGRINNPQRHLRNLEPERHRHRRINSNHRIGRQSERDVIPRLLQDPNVRLNIHSRTRKRRRRRPQRSTRTRKRHQVPTHRITQEHSHRLRNHHIPTNNRRSNHRHLRLDALVEEDDKDSGIWGELHSRDQRDAP